MNKPESYKCLLLVLDQFIKLNTLYPLALPECNNYLNKIDNALDIWNDIAQETFPELFDETMQLTLKNILGVRRALIERVFKDIERERNG